MGQDANTRYVALSIMTAVTVARLGLLVVDTTRLQSPPHSVTCGHIIDFPFRTMYVLESTRNWLPLVLRNDPRLSGLGVMAILTGPEPHSNLFQGIEQDDHGWLSNPRKQRKNVGLG